MKEYILEPFDYDRYLKNPQLKITNRTNEYDVKIELADSQWKTNYPLLATYCKDNYEHGTYYVTKKGKVYHDSTEEFRHDLRFKIELENVNSLINCL